jgi:hypothetical protein
MKSKPCDRLAANIVDAQQRWNCEIDFPTVVWLIEEVERRYDPQTEDFETTLENAMHARDIEQSVQWQAYKMALGAFFGTRALYKKEKAGRH